MIATTMLRLNKDFKKAYARGKPMAHPLIVTYALKNNLGIRRLGITASKKTGNAVSRNRARRLIREAYRLLESGVPAGWDFVFVARKATSSAPVKLQNVLRAMEKHIASVTAPRGPK